MRKIALLISMSCLVSGCVSMSRTSYEGRSYLGITKENLVFNSKDSLKDAGIIIGRVTKENDTGVFADYTDRLVTFKNINTGQELNYYGADYFFMRLPVGVYEITSFETRWGLCMRPLNGGFEFKVRNGEIIYIGSIIGEEGFKKRSGLKLIQGTNEQSALK